ncbi:WxL domain-containing protein [Enterococcus quebecensis]|uniref:WxL domain-containing protein n=1 Tax=Enterococcus quebecensis TaxID=903983 RepID=A0A1E5GX54_9ENTE|nr:WxL domain-containing protein [Enterococcus quebecensis]OEG17236.1 hypothetical protein BCR23_04330 [Enterococcus quebecensis]OJG75632.1 hypothetical protein RV12_GL001435 [Enterococcus quebecensis]
MRKKISLVFLIGCLSILSLNYFSNERIKASDEKGATETTVFQDVNLTKYDLKTKTVSKTPIKNGETINYDDTFQVKYHLSIPDEMKLTKNQTFSTKVPLLMPSNNGSVEVKDKQENVLGTWNIIDETEGSKVLVFEVSDFFADFKKREVDIEFLASLDSSVENKKQVLTFQFDTANKLKLDVTMLKVSSAKKTTMDSNEKTKSETKEKSTTKPEEKDSVNKKDDQVIEPKKAANENKAETYSIKVNTVDADDHSIPVNGMVVLYSHNNLSDPIKSVPTVNGEYIFSDLQSGKYRIAGGVSEVAGYFARQGATYFDVDLPSDNTSVVVEYMKGWGSVRLTKRDADTNKVLPGAKFNLVKNNENNTTELVKADLISDEKGIVQVDQLFKGNYSFIETQAPEGYVLAEEDKLPVDVSLADVELVYPDPSSKPLWYPTNMKTKTNKKADVKMTGSTFPTNLDFGKTKIQHSKDETLTANENGVPTVGQVVIDDTRTSGGWTLKVKQNEDFITAEGTPLLNTDLNLEIGPVSNTISNSPSQVEGTVDLKSGVEAKIAVAKTTEGTGTTTIPLNKFSLKVPRTTNKKASQYNSSLTWTLSDVPQ